MTDFFKSLLIMVPLCFASVVLFSFARHLASQDSPDLFAKEVLPGISYSEIISTKESHWSFYGCTYAVVRLPSVPNTEPPEGKWYPFAPTPLSHEQLKGDARIDCLKSGNRNWTGEGIDGYGSQLFELLMNPGSWVQLSDQPHDGYITIYAPKKMLAAYVRVGD